MKFRNLTRVKKKSFLLITFLGPIFFAAVAVLPTVIMMMTEDKGKKVAVVDESSVVMPSLTDSETVMFTDFSSMSVDSLKTTFISDGFDVLVHISQLDSAASVTVSAYSEKPISVDLKDAISSKINAAIEDYRIEAYEVDGLKEIMENVKALIKTDLESFECSFSVNGSEKGSNTLIYNLYGSGETAQQQLQAARMNSELEGLRGGY